MGALLASRRRERIEQLARRALGCALDPSCERVAAVNQLTEAALDADDVREAIQILLDEVRPTAERERATALLSCVLTVLEAETPVGA